MKKETDKMQPSTLFEGMVSIRPLLQDTAKRKIIKLWIDQTKYEKKSKEIRFLEHQSEQLGFSIETLNPEELQAMALGTSHGGIIASCTQRTLPALRLADIESNGFYVYLEGIEDPYNFGYALRSLFAAGVTGVVVSERNWMSAAGVVCRASAGASERFDLYEADPTAAAALVRRAGYQIIGTGYQNAQSVYQTALRRPLFLIIGGEKRGISRAVCEKCDQLVRIDYGRDCPFSLSAASAASILAFEILRQNNF